MTNLSRWDPFQDLLAIQDEMNQVFGRALGRGERGGGEAAARGWAPALDIAERNDAYVVTVEVPGIKPEELEITVEDGTLTISGERRFESETKEQQFHRVERRYGAFRRSITLPAGVRADAIDASFEDGLLKVVVPKAEEAKPRRIEVRGRQPVEGTSSTA
ncbi:MAG TPA: Hsp20/alpha crystallin family protein [Actinomycetota bacterium]|jgi:HSP20 family protein